MSGILQVNPTPAEVMITSWSPTFISRSHSMVTQRRRRGAAIQRWKIAYRYATLTHEDAMRLSGFINAQRGQYEAFTIYLPTAISPRGTWAGSPVADGAAAVGQSTVAIRGLDDGATGERGDFLKFSGHTKVYQLLDSFEATGSPSGEVSITITPSLITSVSDAETVTVSSVPFNVILEDDEQSVSFSPGVFGTLELNMIEDY